MGISAALPLAIGGSAIAGGVANIFGSRAQEKGATRAGAAQEAAQLAAIEEQRRQFDIMQQQTAPWRQAGLQALPELQKWAGAESPGYRLEQEATQQALDRYLAKAGLFSSGFGAEQQRRAAEEIAAREGEAQYGRLFNLANIGMGQQSQLNQARMNMAGNIGQAYGNIGSAQGQAAYQVGQARGGLFDFLAKTASGLPLTYQYLSYLNKPGTTANINFNAPEETAKTTTPAGVNQGWYNTIRRGGW